MAGEGHLKGRSSSVVRAAKSSAPIVPILIAGGAVATIATVVVIAMQKPPQTPPGVATIEFTVDRNTGDPNTNFSFTVTPKDSSAVPKAGVPVYLFDNGATVGLKGTTDSQGRLTFSSKFSAGTHSLFVANTPDGT